MKIQSRAPVAALVILAALLAGCASGYQAKCYQEPGGATLTCDSGGTLQVKSGGALNVERGATTTFGNDPVFGGRLLLSSTDITPTAGETITPAYTLYRISAAGAVSVTLAACATPGQMLYLYGVSNQTVTVNDSNIRTSSGNAITFGQYDLVAWICSGTEWIEQSLLADS